MPSNKNKQYENRTIVLPFEEATYDEVVSNPILYRKQLKCFIETYPKLFPPEIGNGFRMKDRYYSSRLGLLIRRIEVAGTAYSIRPSLRITPFNRADKR